MKEQHYNFDPSIWGVRFKEAGNSITCIIKSKHEDIIKCCHDYTQYDINKHHMRKQLLLEAMVKYYDREMREYIDSKQL